jgi:stress-induced morphogen
MAGHVGELPFRKLLRYPDNRKQQAHSSVMSEDDVLPAGRGPVITEQTLTEYIRRAMPDAAVTMIDKTGTMDHLKVMIVSDAFQGKNLLDRHRLIYQALDAPMKDGRIHALELTANTKEEHEQRVDTR